MRDKRLRAVAFILLLLLSLNILGCKSTSRTWSAQAKSPDGRFIATAETYETGGFGGDAPTETYVELNWTGGSQKPTLVFSFVGGPEVPGGMDVGIRWLDSRHLDLLYKGKPEIDFQAIRWAEVEISAHSD